MNILYVGDIMGETGINTVEKLLPDLKKQHQVDVVVAQAENVTDGKGLSKTDFQRLQRIGVDFCTGGNWTLQLDELKDYLNDPQQPVVRPANYPAGTPGRGWKYLEGKHGKILVISLLGKIVGRDADKPVDNPLIVVDEILQENKDVERAATIVNFHGDYSSEKRIIGYYLDGRVTAVIGDHWHVPTADAMVLPKGTAHMTDVGMCGSLHSSLGVSLDSVIPRWKDGTITKNQLATEKPHQFNATIIEADKNGFAISVEHIQRIIT
ncbi:MAG: TIGR00282 family metallophosphoesterase [Candidatus Saccharibacteria bacterium]|nr:TIGR00282 family metallophosphoesterase [Candidatus Saccharibacteria bacterium]